MDTSSSMVVEQFVRALAARDLAATKALYAPDALFEVHVPGWDALVDDPAEIGDLLQDFFVGRDAFRVSQYEILGADQTAAVRLNLEWRDAHDGAPCVCFQSHFFETEAGAIHLHRMYCAGVRVQRQEAGAPAA
jgi:hypothetical protein